MAFRTPFVPISPEAKATADRCMVDLATTLLENRDLPAGETIEREHLRNGLEHLRKNCLDYIDSATRLGEDETAACLETALCAIEDSQEAK